MCRGVPYAVSPILDVFNAKMALTSEIANPRLVAISTRDKPGRIDARPIHGPKRVHEGQADKQPRLPDEPRRLGKRGKRSMGNPVFTYYCASSIS